MIALHTRYRMLQKTIDEITALDDLRPSPVVNALFTQLVDLVVTLPDETMVDGDVRQSIQRAASNAETEMEIYWASKIINSIQPHEAVREFPYTDNYAKLVAKEIALIEESGHLLTSKSRVLIIGSGPLPMTALELIRQRSVHVDHVDISPAAITLCQQVNQRLDVDCGHILGDGASISPTSQYDVVLIAGLAGESVQHKQAIINNLLPALSNSGRLLLRSARGIRSLLYPGVRSTEFYDVRLLSEYHPSDDVINSVFIYEKE